MKEYKKRIILIISIILVIIIVFSLVKVFKESENRIFKTEYGLNETAEIDDIKLKLTNANYINNSSGIEVTFEITNKQDNTITITPDDYFKLYDINKVQIPNKFSNNKNIVKKDETVIYKLQYDIAKRGLYEIYFYSQIAENNIKFSFNSKSIELDKVTEGGSDKEEEKVIENN